MTPLLSNPLAFLSRRITWITYVVWAVFSVLLILQVALYGVNLPQWDDWTDMVPIITGKRPLTAEWLWSPNGGRHRVFVPRLIEICTLRLSGNDFRGGMFLNVIFLIVACYIFLAALRRTRADRQSRIGDLAVPLLVLGWSHYGNVLWAYQIQFLLMVLLISCLWYLIVVSRKNWNTMNLVLATVVLALLPLCGSNGLAFVPPFAIWLIWSGIVYYRKVSVVAIGTGALLWCTLCFVPVGEGTGISVSHSLTNLLAVGNEILAFGFGMAAVPSTAEDPLKSQLISRIPLLVLILVILFKLYRKKNTVTIWLLGAIILAAAAFLPQLRPIANTIPALLVIGTCLAATLVCVWELCSSSPAQRAQAGAFFAILLSSVLLNAALIVGRSSSGTVIRYVTLGMLPLLISYMILSSQPDTDEAEATLHAPTLLSRFAQSIRLTTLLLIVILAPLNLYRVRSILAATTPPFRDKIRVIASGISASHLLAHHDLSVAPEVAYNLLTELRSAGIPPYKYLVKEQVPDKQEKIFLRNASMNGVELSRDGQTLTSTAGGTVTFLLGSTYKNPLVRVKYAYRDAKAHDPTIRMHAQDSKKGILSGSRDDLHLHDDLFPNYETINFVEFQGEVSAIVFDFPPKTKIDIREFLIEE